LSGKHGWASDHVVNYEVILANGSITNVNPTSHADLFWALRGGGNQFGIVTNFDVDAFEQGPVWGGFPFYFFSDTRARAKTLGATDSFSLTSRLPMHLFGRGLEKLLCAVGRCTTLQKYFEAIVAMGEKSDAEEDEYYGFYASMAYNPSIDNFAGCAHLTHSKPESNPAVFKEFIELKAIQNPLGIHSLTKLITMVDVWQEPGKRQVEEFFQEILKLIKADGHLHP
jgi:hypothetical protein